MYELLAEDSLEDLIHYGGGLLATAHRNSGQIERVHSQDGFTLIDVDLNSSELDSIPLIDGDTVYAFPILNTMQNERLQNDVCVCRLKCQACYLRLCGLRCQTCYMA